VVARRRKKTKRVRATKSKKGVRIFVVLFLGLGAVFCLQIREWKGGINKFLIHRGPVELSRPVDLADLQLRYGVQYQVKGIPDYAHRLSRKVKGEANCCFRMVGFENRIVVCSRQLEVPTSIDQVLTPHTFAGVLLAMDKTSLGEQLRSGFRDSHGLDLPPKTFLLLDGAPTRPSLKKFLFLCVAGLVGIFSFLKIIKNA
jgi:hypothetical protein